LTMTWFVPATAGDSVIVLPTAPPGGVRITTQQLLPTDSSVEVSHAPGSVSDEEVVRVALDPSGAVASVVVDQVLALNGLGDFALEIPGPATNVTAPPDESPQPGLRGGNVIWQW